MKNLNNCPHCSSPEKRISKKLYFFNDVIPCTTVYRCMTCCSLYIACSLLKKRFLIRKHFYCENYFYPNATHPVKDNGIGFDLNKKLKNSDSLGMKTLKERTKIINGNIKVQSIIGKGTKTTLLTPITNES